MGVNSQGEPDYYAALGLLGGATREEIESAFRRLARECHPDACPGLPDAAERFKAVAAAYETLGDAARRRDYDRRRAAQGRPITVRSAGAASPAAGFPWKTPVGPARRVHLSPHGGLLDEIRGMFDPPIGPATGAAAGLGEPATGLGAEWPVADLDISAQLVLTPGEARHGTLRRLAYQVEELCPICCGQGVAGVWYCIRCEGSGIERRGRRVVEVRVPPGVRTGTVLSIAGAGRLSLASGRRGSLNLHVIVAQRR